MSNRSVNDLVMDSVNAVRTIHLTSLIKTTLRSAAAQKIDFWAGNIHVDGAGLLSVVDAMINDKITVTIGALPADTEAQYSNDTPADGHFIFPNATYGTTAFQRAAILHESVHAMQDVAGGTLLSARGSVFTKYAENETAAFIAGALFNLYASSSTGWGDDPLFVFADQIAQSIQNRRGAAVPKAELAMLRALIVSHAPYNRLGVTYVTPTGANGVSRPDVMEVPSPEDLGPVRVTAKEDALVIHIAGDALFDFGKDILKPEAMPLLAKAGARILSTPGYRISIEGHTDSIGDDRVNMPLSQRRAMAVGEWLVAQRFVQRGNFKTLGWGKSRPAAPNTKPNGADNPEGRKLNRRVEIILVKKT
jgi:outer membrane protein OmpA-like peptidoglycan-associated protein